MADAGTDHGGAARGHYVSEATSPSRMILKMAL
jgi:hypothetical protein